ncbi:MAG: hypothetical protein ACRCXB_22965 [Aeromonadaceae bacterium]
MERLIADPRKFPPKIIEKAKAALVEGLRRPVNYKQKHWLQISVGLRHRLLLKGDGKALLFTHETMNSFVHRRGHNA